jgi:hypothetical protein
LPVGKLGLAALALAAVCSSRRENTFVVALARRVAPIKLAPVSSRTFFEINWRCLVYWFFVHADSINKFWLE